MSSLISICRKSIEYSFYILFFLIPIIFWKSTSELFELNKMWLTFGLTLIILAAWLTEMIADGRIRIKKSPLDLLLILFLISQFFSTIISLDSHVSFWGYYSRFNGGLLSTITYIFLYYAFITHFSISQVIRTLKITLFSGLIVALWGIPSHYGYDLTCYLFRGTLDVSCWTDAFKPTIRIFSTLGQPAWLAAYFATLIPIAIAFLLKLITESKEQNFKSTFSTSFLSFVYYLTLIITFYLSLMFSNTRAGFIGFWISNILFWFIILVKKYLPLKTYLSIFVFINLLFFTINFFVGTPVAQLNKFTYMELGANKNAKSESIPPIEQTSNLNVTDSGNIRLHVWEGAINAWKSSPIFGSGVETFAFAYYQHRPIGHNLTSEWDYLYNKAHNEYLNFLTTSGLFGLGTYLMFIGVFIYLITKNFILKTNLNTKLEIKETKFNASQVQYNLIIVGLFTGWLSILVTNFFGFSVVITNLFLFIIPAMVLIIGNLLLKNNYWMFPKNKDDHDLKLEISMGQGLSIFIVLMIILYFLFILLRFWEADKQYNLGYNYNRSNLIQDAYTSLSNAINLRPSEPIYQDELSITSLQLALGLYQQNEATLAAQLIQQSVQINENILNEHPNYLPFWKSRIRIFYALGELDPSYNSTALQAAEQAAKLAPTDAKIWYNLGTIYGQNKQFDKSIQVLQKTIKMKPDYFDVYHTLALIYRQMAIDENGNVINPKYQKEAEETLNKLLKMNPEHAQAIETMKSWK